MITKHSHFEPKKHCNQGEFISEAGLERVVPDLFFNLMMLIVNECNSNLRVVLFNIFAFTCSAQLGAALY